MFKKYQCRERLRETLKWLYNWWCSGANKTEQSGAFSPSDFLRREWERRGAGALIAAEHAACVSFLGRTLKVLYFGVPPDRRRRTKLIPWQDKSLCENRPKKADRVSCRRPIKNLRGFKALRFSAATRRLNQCLRQERDEREWRAPCRGFNVYTSAWENYQASSQGHTT